MTVMIIAAVLIIILCLPFIWAKMILNRYDQVEYFSGTGFDLARLLLDRSGLERTEVEETQLGDHYDPRSDTVRLNTNRCRKRSLTSVVVAAHEVGHALQAASGYPLLKIRTKMAEAAISMEKLGAILIIVVPVLALMIRIPSVGLVTAVLGFMTMSLPLLVHLITLPVEFDASFKRAFPLLKQGFIPDEDRNPAKRILMACALTYVAGAMISLLNVWRWLRLLKR